MSFQYGSDSIDIPNPFKREGLLSLASGLVWTVLGAISVLMLRSRILDSGSAAGWVSLIVSLLLLGIGVRYLVNGLLKIFRFYVGRGIPASLAKNLASSESLTVEPELMYEAKHLEQMLVGRKNPTFNEPSTLIERLVFSIFPKFLFLPYPIRNYIQIIVHKAAYSLMFLFVFIIAVLSGSVGLTKLVDSSYPQWMGLIMSILLLIIWRPASVTIKKINRLRIESIKLNGVITMTILAVLVPVVFEVLLKKGVGIPEAPLDPTVYLVTAVILMLVTTLDALFMAKKRADMLDPRTEVSEYMDNWQENVHPKDIFISFDREMAKSRYKEMPNRIYCEMKPELIMEGSMDKGSFTGDTIQETQPIYEEVKYPAIYSIMRLATSAFGHLLICLSALLLFLNNRDLPDLTAFKPIMDTFYFPLLLWSFGSIAVNIAHIAWAEINFKSILIYFKGEGTYTESKLSYGMAITDSARSENVVVRTSIAPTLIVSDITSCTFACSGPYNLKRARYVMDMRKADAVLDEIVKGIRGFLESRQVIANAASEKDIDSMGNLYNLNRVSPAANLAAQMPDPILGAAARQENSLGSGSMQLDAGPVSVDPETGNENG